MRITIKPDVATLLRLKIVLGDMKAEIEYLAVSDLLKLTDGVRPSVFEVAVDVACKT